MTTIYEGGPADGGRLHALVIGVDHYPYGGRRARVDNVWREFVRAVKPLTCAVPSALAIVDWLHRHLDDRVNPVGSIELLLSAPDTQHVNGHEIEHATMAGVKDAFDRWYERCDQSTEDVAFLFFCGHGLRLGSEDVLLLEDFAAVPHRIFENAIDFRETYYGMQTARAGTQCFLLDACRNTPDDLMGREKTGATALRQAPPPPLAVVRDAPIIYSTAEGTRAPAADMAPTRFTTAAVQALEGGAADQTLPGWPVTTNLLPWGIDKMLEWHERHARRQFVAWGGQSRGGIIHALGPPRVPFRLGCDPHAALPYAHLHLADGTYKLDRPPAEVVWQDETPAGVYSMRADFEGGDYVSDPANLMVLPPYKEWNLPVRPV